MQKCTKCKLLNPPEAVWCDCGYDFPTGEMRGSYLQKSERDGSVIPIEKLADRILEARLWLAFAFVIFGAKACSWFAGGPLDSSS